MPFMVIRMREKYYGVYGGLEVCCECSQRSMAHVPWQQDGTGRAV
jgi:hypothetical protein